MIKHTISILLAERDHYFAHGLYLGLKAHCSLRGRSLRLVERCTILVHGVDIIFLGDSVTCPPWLYDLYQQGYTPHVFFIRDQLRDEPMAPPLLPIAHAAQVRCTVISLYRQLRPYSIQSYSRRKEVIPSR